MAIKICCLLALLTISFPLSAAEIFRHVDQHGNITYTDQKRSDAHVRLVKTWKGWQVNHRTTNLKQRMEKFSPLVATASERYEISPELISAIIHVESHYNPKAISSKGAVGLMQLMPGTAARYGVQDRQNPKQNIDGGTRYIRDLLELFNQKLELALAAYNAGENAVIRQGNQIPKNRETPRYVDKVLTQYAKNKLDTQKAQGSSVTLSVASP